jgi:NAD(P)-dependent dehydrogenase (short-subunit alcohol dehydrogenase family)
VHAYPPGTEEDLAETVRQVEALDRRIVAHKADVRDTQALKAAVDGVAQLGRRDIVSANAGIYQMQPAVELDDDDWQETIDTGRSFGDHGHQTAALSVEV